MTLRLRERILELERRLAAAEREKGALCRGEADVGCAEVARKETDREWGVILDSMGERLSYFAYRDLTLRWANRASCRSLKTALRDLQGRYCYEIWHNREAPCDVCPVIRAFETGRIQDEEVLSPHGKVWHVRAYPVSEDGGEKKGVITITQDITHRKRMERKLQRSEERYRKLSIVDDLTRLFNVRHFFQQLKLEMSRAKRYGLPLALLLLDLDDFKQYNDTFGHVEGDRVLSRFGKRVKKCLRQTDSAYRYGGEEFTVLLPMTTSGDAAGIAERIRLEVKEERFSPLPDTSIHVTVSIGLTPYRYRENMKAFISRVDRLMYQAKREGKDRICAA